MDLLFGAILFFIVMLAFNAFGYFGFLRGEKGVSKTRWFTLSVVITCIFVGIALISGLIFEHPVD